MPHITYATNENRIHMKCLLPTVNGLITSSIFKWDKFLKFGQLLEIFESKSIVQIRTALTLPIDKILSVKNARVSMVSQLRTEVRGDFNIHGTKNF